MGDGYGADFRRIHQLPVDSVALGKLIDTLCDMSKIVNYDGVPAIEPEQVKGDGENE